MSRKLIIILGPTAVGKTDYSIDLALRYGSPVISCDSRQIYKEMTIGTAVPSAEQLAAVQHYFIHSHTVTELYTAGKYARIRHRSSFGISLMQKFWGLGIGTAMMHGAILKCKEKGIEKCYVNSFGWRRKFYNAAGFITEDTVGFWYKKID